MLRKEFVIEQAEKLQEEAQKAETVNEQIRKEVEANDMLVFAESYREIERMDD